MGLSGKRDEAILAGMSTVHCLIEASADAFMKDLARGLALSDHRKDLTQAKGSTKAK